MLIPSDTTGHVKSIELPLPLVKRLWCTNCGNEVGMPATHDCAVNEDSVEKRKNAPANRVRG